MPLREERIDQARLVLAALADEHIVSRETTSPYILKKLGLLRHKVWTAARSYNMFNPGLTTSTAITLLKVAGCGELSQRFIADYSLASKTAECSLISLKSIQNPKENHAVVFIGAPRAPERLFDKHGFQPADEGWFSLDEFLSSQDVDSVIVDPLLNSYGNDAITRLKMYCDEHQISHINGILQFNDPILLERVDMIKSNAAWLATQVNCSLLLGLLNKTTPPEFFLEEVSPREWSYHPEFQLFFLQGREEHLSIIHKKLQGRFTTGVGGELQLVTSKKSQALSLIINKKAHELDCTTFFAMDDLSDAMHQHGFLTSTSRGLAAVSMQPKVADQDATPSL